MDTGAAQARTNGAITPPLPRTPASPPLSNDQTASHESGFLQIPNARPSQLTRSASAPNFWSDYDYPHRGEPDRTQIKPKTIRSQPSQESTQTTGDDDIHEPRIWQKRQATWRAQLPDLRWGSTPASAASKEPRNTILSLIDLNWTKKDNKLWLNTSRNLPDDSHLDALKEIAWKHCQDDKVLSLAGFEALTENEPLLYTEREHKITTRTLANIKRVRESKLVEGDGSYLEPAVSRYDSHDPSGKTPDRCGTFVNFPYLEVRQVKKPEKSDHVEATHHPIRSLLRSYFRLSKTVDQDRRQAISFLKYERIKACLEPAPARKFDTKCLAIFVPQFWALILGEGALVTNGYIYFPDLIGPKIRVGPAERETPVALNDSPLIRISFKGQNDRENSLVFPLDQCDCFFGLLHKQRQILQLILGSDFRGENAVKYPIVLEDTGERINNNSWLVSILLKREQHEEIRVRITSEEAGTAPNSPQVPQGTRPTTVALLPDRPDVTSIERKFLLPLLEWKVIDEYSQEEKGLNPHERATRFLTNACDNLPARLKGSATARSSRRSSTTVPLANSPYAYEGKTYQQVLKRLQATGNLKLQSEHFARCKLVMESTQRLLNLFVNKDMSNEEEACRYIWGAIFLLLDNPKRLSETDFLWLSHEIHSIWEHTAALHAGVYRQHASFKNRNTGKPEDQLASGAILLKSMVQGFENILRMYFELGEIARKSRNKDPSVNILGKAAPLWSYGADAIRKLRLAKGELIYECDGNVRKNGLGPSATPEGILISLLDRLSCGVYGDTEIKIIELYNESLQRLAEKVRKEPSRRVLRNINEIVEEITIITEIFTQQDKVLSEFQKSINWTSYDTPPEFRRFNFEYETEAIQRIQKRVRGHMDDCKELQKRATQISAQNVQILKTVQDDNNKVLYVFTVVTVLFLPASFVSSYFGMNVTNIRDTTQSASHFWVIAGPLTLGILFASFLFAYKGNTAIAFFSALLRRR